MSLALSTIVCLSETPADTSTRVHSAGGNLSLALLQTILELGRQKIKIAWFGAERDVPLPAGVAVNSPWMDLTHSSPSYMTKAGFDYLPPPPPHGLGTESMRPPCPAWPTVPPREHIYVDDGLVLHPLVTLLMVRSWAGAPPVCICTGWELLRDEDRYAAGKLHRDDVTVVLEEYEGMPHCFALMFADLDGARRCMAGWAGFIRRAVEELQGRGEVGGEEEGREGKSNNVIRTTWTTIKAKSLLEETVDPDSLTEYSEALMRKNVFERCGIKVPADNDAAARL